MAEYIDRDDALSALVGSDIIPVHIPTIMAAEKRINDIPAADVVEIVRCGECKHFSSVKAGCFLGVCKNSNSCHSENWFCADGERKGKDLG